MVQYIEAKSILSKLNQTDSFFGISYNMNLYRGCQHGCIYCDTRSECYGVGDISKISVKQNAIELLRKELKSKRGNKATIGTGSMNDPYMPVEKELEMTRKALQVLSDFKFPVHIITKSDLVTRDLDLLKEISRTYAAVSITITTFDDKLASRIEPNAPVPSKRFEVLRLLAKHGIYAGITLMPILPFINDTSDNIRRIISKAKDCGAKYAIPMFGMTLRKGSRDYYYKELDRMDIFLRSQYEQTYGEQYECMSPNVRQLWEVFNESNIPSQMDFYEPEPDKQLSLF